MLRRSPIAGASRRPSPRTWIGIGGAAAVLGLLVLAGARPIEPPVPTASGATAAQVTPFASPTPVAEPSFADPSDVGRWSPARYAQDWPGGLRGEPGGRPVLIDLIRGDKAAWDPTKGVWGGVEHVDPEGDGPPEAPWLDIVNVLVGWAAIASFRVELAADMPLPLVSPEERWMAFGIVLDTDHDGHADIRFGADNMPTGDHRTWRTDYRLGHTAWEAGPPYGFYDHGPMSGTSNDTWYPGEGDTAGLPSQALFRYFLKADERDAHFYAWASVIEGGRVVATDYAPDAGWLVFDRGDLPLLGNVWSIDSVTSPLGTATTRDWFEVLATFGDDGAFSIDACAPIDAFATIDGSSLRLRDVKLGTPRGCPGEIFAIDDVIRAVVAARNIEYTLERGGLVLRAGQYSIRLIGRSEQF